MTGNKTAGFDRLKREKETLKAMFHLFCSGSGHNVKNYKFLCTACSELLEYAEHKIDRCVFLKDKPTCVKCPVHCYEPKKREAVRDVMRYSGPKMPFKHPLLSAMHVIDGILAGKGAVKKCSK